MGFQRQSIPWSPQPVRQVSLTHWPATQHTDQKLPASIRIALDAVLVGGHGVRIARAVAQGHGKAGATQDLCAEAD